MPTYDYFTCPNCKMRARREVLGKAPVSPRLWVFDVEGSPPGVGKGGGHMRWIENTNPADLAKLATELRYRLQQILQTL